MQRREARRRGPAWVRRIVRSERDEPNLDHVRRIGARFLGLGFIGYPIVSPTNIVMSGSITASWWIPLSIVMSVVPGLALFLASFRDGTRWLAPLSICLWICYLVTVALWFVAWDGTTIVGADDVGQWMIAFCGMPAMVLMLVDPRLSAAGLVTCSLLGHMSQQVGRFGQLTRNLGFEEIWSIAFTAVFLAVVLVAIRTARSLDETQEVTYHRAAVAAAATAREVEKARFDAIVHDRVISSLLAVREGTPDERLAVQARSALDELVRMPAQEGGAVSRAETLRRIRSAAAGISERIEVRVFGDSVSGTAASGQDASGGDGGGYPVEVVEAVVEAMSEALRNVARHAGTEADCAVIVQLADDGLSMAVVDNGEGFDPDEVAPGRIGIEVSIVGRMSRVDGGHARVSSRPGRGTTVRIGWEKP